MWLLTANSTKPLLGLVLFFDDLSVLFCGVFEAVVSHQIHNQSKSPCSSEEDKLSHIMISLGIVLYKKF